MAIISVADRPYPSPTDELAARKTKLTTEGGNSVFNRMGLAATTLPLLSQASARVAVTAEGHRSLSVGSKSIVSMPAKDAAAALRQDGEYRLLDVRPSWERERAWLRRSIHVPLYVEDTQVDPLTLLKKWVHFGYIGLWTGQRFTTLNPSFLLDVERVVPDKDGKLLVACGEGLRSVVAVRKLSEGGYENLAWLEGGFSRAGVEEFDGVEGSMKLQYATVGGLSYYFLQLLLLLKNIQPVGGRRKMAVFSLCGLTLVSLL